MGLREKIQRHPNVEQDQRFGSTVWDEGENGKWAELKSGLRCDFSGCHTCHEPTWAKLYRAVCCAQPCDPDCPECFPKGDN